MSRTTVLQIIAAVITIAVLAVLHQGLDWFLDQMTTEFILGLCVGSVAVTLAFMINSLLYDERSMTTFGRRHKKSPRDTIDM